MKNFKNNRLRKIFIYLFSLLSIIFVLLLILKEISKNSLGEIKSLKYRNDVYTLYYDYGSMVIEEGSGNMIYYPCYYVKKNNRLFVNRIEEYFFDEKSFLLTKKDSLFLNMGIQNDFRELVYLDSNLSFCELKVIKDKKYKIETVSAWCQFWSKFKFFFQDYEMLWFEKIRDAFHGGEIFTINYWKYGS